MSDTTPTPSLVEFLAHVLQQTRCGMDATEAVIERLQSVTETVLARHVDDDVAPDKVLQLFNDRMCCRTLLNNT